MHIPPFELGTAACCPHPLTRAGGAVPAPHADPNARRSSLCSLPPPQPPRPPAWLLHDRRSTVRKHPSPCRGASLRCPHAVPVVSLGCLCCTIGVKAHLRAWAAMGDPGGGGGGETGGDLGELWCSGVVWGRIWGCNMRSWCSNMRLWGGFGAAREGLGEDWGCNRSWGSNTRLWGGFGAAREGLGEDLGLQ